MNFSTLILNSTATKGMPFSTSGNEVYFIVKHKINGIIRLETAVDKQTDDLDWVPTGIEWQDSCARAVKVCPMAHYRVVADFSGCCVWVLSMDIAHQNIFTG